ncbi:23S rRNA (uracil(1939)-C(5))-methyltransferase RlmD [Thioalkalivibrio sp. HK1]|uniref:23S rRNA (uracil(1939)-C(5))-methyltransferase RlmD n=1 Tax=Thioalkalivibrio sp. HK1 TaxID=1469245 RepID=UPI0004701F46|nr:23S rRNA (uracil(1939)-C(5))-methyltransferase RlmD [Thioalkalivibrio sp. HK1]
MSASSIEVDDLDSSGRGVGRSEGKVVFIAGALPGEEVLFRRIRRSRNFDEAVVERLLSASADRVEPRCPYYARCGGCTLQHLSYDAQIRYKERQLLTALRKIGGVTPTELLPPLTGEPWRYRRKARFGARHVPRKGEVLVGFRERQPRRITDMNDCEILADPLGAVIAPLRKLIGGLDAFARIPQIEAATGEGESLLVIRHLDPLSLEDIEAVDAFAAERGIGIWLQPAGPASAVGRPSAAERLEYSLARPPRESGEAKSRAIDAEDLPEEETSLRFRFSPLDFTQVNAEVNRALVQRVRRMVRPRSNSRILDAFCGIGNFSLPLAAEGAQVTGLEFGSAMVARAKENAAANHLSVVFEEADLENAEAVRQWLGRGWDAIVLDPPRAGAAMVVEHIDLASPERIVYVSCNPGTLARDAARLQAQGYLLHRVGIADMFAHTSHIEAVAEFLPLKKPSESKAKR